MKKLGNHLLRSLKYIRAREFKAECANLMPIFRSAYLMWAVRRRERIIRKITTIYDMTRIKLSLR